MEKIKADILIRGDLICKEKLIGGGKLYPCRREDVEAFFDIDGACVVEGGLRVDGLDTGDKTVVVCGAVAVEGGGDGEQ